MDRQIGWMEREIVAEGDVFVYIPVTVPVAWGIPSCLAAVHYIVVVLVQPVLPATELVY